MAILLAIRGWDPEGWRERFTAEPGRHEIRVWPEAGDPSEIEYAVAWKPPAGLLAGFSNLRAIFSIGAGVDHLFADPELPSVPIVRFVDPDLTRRMTEYVVLHALLHQRRFDVYRQQQKQRLWKEHADPSAAEVRVGLTGGGVLGGSAAKVLISLGFQVAIWSRSGRTVAGAKAFAAADLDRFLGRTDILVSLLPLTPETRGLLDYELCRKLARDGVLGAPVLINAGRGGLQKGADLLRALDDGTLGGASLDVFETEPLPKESPFWTHPKVYVTPHVSAQSSPVAVARYVLAQIDRLERGVPLENVVDPQRGY